MGFINNKKPNMLFRMGGGSIPTGTININSNGIHTVAGYAHANVNVPQGIVPIGTKNITTNGMHDVTSYANADVNVPGIIPTGTKNITENGTFDVEVYKNVDVNVPTGVTPTGTKTITENGTFDVVNFANADVNVPGIVPTGTISITENGTVDVTQYANANVNVQSGITPTGTRNIVVNGDYDVTTYANAHVEVPNTNILPHMITGAFTYDGSRYIHINNNMKSKRLFINYAYVYAEDISSFSESWETLRKVIEARSNINTSRFSYFDVFHARNSYLTVYAPFFLANGQPTVPPASRRCNTNIYYNNDDYVIDTYDEDTEQPSTISNFKTGDTYYYLLVCSEVLYDFTNSSITKVKTTYNSGETLNLNDMKIEHVVVTVDGERYGHETANIQLRLDETSDNVTIDTSNIDMSTPGTYPLYVTVSWNTTRMFGVNITVV